MALTIENGQIITVCVNEQLSLINKIVHYCLAKKYNFTNIRDEIVYYACTDGVFLDPDDGESDSGRLLHPDLVFAFVNDKHNSLQRHKSGYILKLHSNTKDIIRQELEKLDTLIWFNKRFQLHPEDCNQEESNPLVLSNGNEVVTKAICKRV